MRHRPLDTMKDYLKSVNVVIYVLDARCPDECRNPVLDEFVKNKKIIYAYSFRDLVKNPPPRIEVVTEIKKMFPNKVGYVKAMVVGVPNVGKSTLINKLAKRKKTVTANYEGTTKVPQWVEVAPRIYLLDTPGVYIGGAKAAATNEHT